MEEAQARLTGGEIEKITAFFTRNRRAEQLEKILKRLFVSVYVLTPACLLGPPASSGAFHRQGAAGGALDSFLNILSFIILVGLG